jgi:hypothetical protein
MEVLFILTTLLTVFLFWKATRYSRPVLFLLISWLALQTGIAATGFYLRLDILPPRFLLLVLPPLLLTIVIFCLSRGKRFIQNMDMATLTLLHTVRVPVELVLYGLFLQKAVPCIMTFECGNYDIVSGLTAPLVWYFGVVKKWLGRTVMLLWNFVCMGLLFNIVRIAILSAPSPFQHFAFDQPNTAVIHFPYVWLPCCIVPLVLFSHLTAVAQYLYPDKSRPVQPGAFPQVVQKIK